MKLQLSQIHAWLGLPGEALEGETLGYSIDSRTLRPGDLFFAIRGPRFDGHDFVPDVLEKGAAAAVVKSEYPVGQGSRLIAVPDPAAALRTLAARARGDWGGVVIAVTGSSGKTTTKDAIATLLEDFLRVAKSEGNLNNEYGLPLSLLRVPEQARAAVVEIGINRPGEMQRLARIASPDVGVVTNVGAAHVGNFASEDEIAFEKGFLIEALEADGTAVLNADDDRVSGMRARCEGRTVTFGIEGPADVRAESLEDSGSEGVRFSLAGAPMSMRLAGRHNVYNVLAAIAAIGPLGIRPARLARALCRLQPSAMRGVVHKAGGVTLIDDCYNANPAAMSAMLQVLRRTSASRRIAVLGEMRELGERSREFHREIGRAAACAGIDYLFAVGGDAAEIASAAGLPGEFHESPLEAASALTGMVRPGDAVLLKASRGVGLEQARDPLLRALGHQCTEERTAI